MSSHRRTTSVNKLDFTPDQSLRYDNMKPALLLYEQVLPLVTNMLELYTTIRLLKINVSYMSLAVWIVDPPINPIEPIQQFFQATFLHPSLEYVKTSYDGYL